MNPARTCWVGNIVAAATDFSALSGLLAGFLIASAAVLFAPGGRCVPYTVAQLASGVPGLVLSSFIFSAITGLTANDAANCDQTWSQGLIAIALLLIGATVLVCGFSWVLVTYSEDLEHILSSQFSRDGTDQKIIKGSQDFVEMVEKRSVLLVSLNGWISGSVIVASAIVLIRVNALYIQSGHYASDALRKALIYLVTAIGLYVIMRSVYTISQRTLNALQRSSPPRKTLSSGGVFASHCRAERDDPAMDRRLCRAVTIRRQPANIYCHLLRRPHELLASDCEETKRRRAITE